MKIHFFVDAEYSKDKNRFNSRKSLTAQILKPKTVFEFLQKSVIQKKCYSKLQKKFVFLVLYTKGAHDKFVNTHILNS